MTELKIDPEFENLIPKLTDAEYAQLEKNILADGRVKEPIVVWNGTIIDGHHRYYIVQKHPEIPFEIEERDFANRHEAMAWACANQLGRRNLSSNDASLLRGTQFQETKMSKGGQAGNTNAKKRIDENQPFVSDKSTREKIAEQNHVSENTIMHDDWYAKGIKVAEEILPGSKETILHGDIKIPKYLVEGISKVTPDKQRKAVFALSDGDVQKAKDILEEKKETLEKYGLNDDGEEISFTADDLLEELTENFKKCMDCLKTTVSSHKDIIDAETSDRLEKELGEMFESKIKEFMEEL